MSDEPQPADTGRRRRRRPAAEQEPIDPPGSPGGAASAVAPPLAVPSALGEKLHAQDRRLLSAPLRVDESDLFPDDQEPRFLAQPPVPSLGTDAERYTEGTGARRFRKAPAPDSEGLLPLAEAGAEPHLRMGPPPPHGGTQAAMFVMGVTFHASAGILAGISLAQSLASPGFETETLVMHMAYASVALTLQRAANSLSLFAFLGAADRHFGARTWASGFGVFLYALYSMLAALQLPVDAVLYDARQEREPALMQHLADAGDDPSLLDLTNLTRFPEMIVESPNSDKFIDFTSISSTLLDYHQTLGVMRTLVALLAWVITCREDPGALVTVPPLPERESLS